MPARVPACCQPTQPCPPLCMPPRPHAYQTACPKCHPPEFAQVQRTHRLCVSRDLSEHDIVARVMRRENYLVGMLNKVGDTCFGCAVCGHEGGGGWWAGELCHMHARQAQQDGCQ